MEIYIIVPIVLFIVIFVISELLKKESKSRFRKKTFLLNSSELSFYKYLLQHLPPYISIMCQVRLADIVEPISKGKTRMSDLNRIKAKSIDFVLINTNNSQIIALIELNGSSHLRYKRKKRDSFLEQLFKDVKLCFFIVEVRGHYDIKDIQSILDSL